MFSNRLDDWRNENRRSPLQTANSVRNEKYSRQLHDHKFKAELMCFGVVRNLEENRPNDGAAVERGVKMQTEI